jgi:hypothetical protein
VQDAHRPSERWQFVVMAVKLKCHRCKQKFKSFGLLQRHERKFARLGICAIRRKGLAKPVRRRRQGDHQPVIDQQAPASPTDSALDTTGHVDSDDVQVAPLRLADVAAAAAAAAETVGSSTAAADAAVPAAFNSTDEIAALVAEDLSHAAADRLLRVILHPSFDIEQVRSAYTNKAQLLAYLDKKAKLVSSQKQIRTWNGCLAAH